MILVFGATGNVGKHLVPLLLDEGESVRVFTRDVAKANIFDQSVQKFQGNLDNTESISKAMKDIDSIFLLASTVNHVQNVVREAKKEGIENIIDLSTQVAGSDPPIGQGIAHREREKIIEESGINFTHIRPTMFMTNTFQWVNEIKFQNKVSYPGGAGKIAPIDPYDIANVISVVLTKKGFEQKSLELTGPELLSIGEMVKIISQLTSKPIEYQNLSDEEFADKLRSYKINEHVIAGLVETFKIIKTNKFAYTTNVVKDITDQEPHNFKTWCTVHLSQFQ